MFIVDAKIKINNKELDEKIYGNLEKIKVSSAVDALDVARVVFHDPYGALQENADFDIGKDVSIEMGFPEYEKIFEGEIVRIDFDFSKGRAVTAHVICYDKLFKLSKMVHSRPFLKMKDSDIAKKMAGEAGLQVTADATDTKHEYIFQNNESNLDFLRRRADRLGYELAIEKGKMIFKKARFKDKKTSVNLSWHRTLIDFHAKVDASAISEEVMVSSWDFVKKKGVEEKVKAGDEPKIGTADTVGTKDVKSKMKNKTKTYRIDIPNLPNADAKTLAKAKLTEQSMTFLKATGSCEGEPKIMSGKVITIENIGAKLTGEYYIVSCEHIYTGASYKTFFEVVSNGTRK